MLYIFRLIVAMIYNILACVLGSIYCLFSPHNSKHVATFGYMFDRLAPLLGLRVECRRPIDARSYGNVIYIANHQNNYDMVTASSIVQPPMMMVGKKNLLWIPFFGQLYWLTGNLLIDRNNRTKAHGIIAEVVNHFRERRISIWMFPEGTRSRGRGLLPFKTGASRVAIAASIPTIPVCISTTLSKINLNRLCNGLVTVEMLPSIDVSRYGKDQARELTAYCRLIMEQRIAEPDKEVVGREAAREVQVSNLYFYGEHLPVRYYFNQFYME